MRIVFFTLSVLLLAVTTVGAQALRTASFAEFDKRAQHGETLRVVFFGASLTWGANATDQALTSYRARVQDALETRYPRAHFKCYDAAIGGTGSQLGVFRLNRDVLSRKPDLVFLDFTANDDIGSADPETLASYESIVRRIILEAQAPVVQMIFPFGWNTNQGTLTGFARREAHLALATDYHTVAGDAVALSIERVKSGQTTVAKIWPSDWVHPGDAGYQLFADAAMMAFSRAVQQKLVCQAPANMRYAATYMTNARVRISTLGPLPTGWTAATPSLTAAWHDGLMSRWLDDVVVASNRAHQPNAAPLTVAPERLKVNFIGSMVMLFGEETVKSSKYHAYLDGKLITYTPWGAKEPIDLYDASAAKFGGNRQHAQPLATGLDATVPHTLEIEPVFDEKVEQELRLESICVAGGKARVWRE